MFHRRNMPIVLATFACIAGFSLVVWVVSKLVCPVRSETEILSSRFGEGRPAADERFTKRYAPNSAHARAKVCWLADGRKHSLKAHVIDLSDDGARIKSRAPLAPETSVVLEMPNLMLAGTAKVRYCQKTTLAYSVGLSFHGPLFRTPS